MIDSFRDEYFFLSNFYPAEVEYEGRTYLNNEAAFQSAKTLDPEIRVQFQGLNPSEAKKLGRSIPLREDWEEIKDRVMYDIVSDKFHRNPLLAEKLIQTGEAVLVEGNNWGDTYWGMCNDEGKNMLGKILMRVRVRLILDRKEERE